MLKKLKNLFRKPIVYSAEEAETIERHIRTYYGRYDTVLHEIVSPDIHVDIYPVKPTPERNYYIMITCGMGARKMAVPEECAGLERAELVMALPPDWDIDGKGENCWWPFRMLKTIARFPIEADTWVGWGHTLDFGARMSPNAAFEGAMLATAASGADGCEDCRLPNGETVNFYQVIPLYRDEMDWKQEAGAEALLNALADVTGATVDIERPSACNENAPHRLFCMDDGGAHREKIRDKGLPLDELTAYQHLAIFLDWLIENKMLCGEFEESHKGTLAAVRGKTYSGDLRAFVRDQLDGVLTNGFLSDEGEDFARWYYGERMDEAHYYPCDVDEYALEYFGEAKYNCAEFQDEAYLFVPWTEEYRSAMKARIDEKYWLWKQERGE